MMQLQNQRWEMLKSKAQDDCKRVKVSCIESFECLVLVGRGRNILSCLTYCIVLGVTLKLYEKIVSVWKCICNLELQYIKWFTILVSNLC